MDNDGPARIYRVPDNDLIDRYAHQVCHELGEEFQSVEVKRGFAAFLKVFARIYANNGDKLRKGD